MTRMQILAAIQAKAKQLGRAPSFRELAVNFRLKKAKIYKYFGTYGAALRACGMDRPCGRNEVAMEELFREWAAVARKLGKVPTIHEYETGSKHTLRPLVRRFGGWRHVPKGMLKYMKEAGLARDWADVVAIIRKHVRDRGDDEPVVRPARKGGNASAKETASAQGQAKAVVRTAAPTVEGPVYGPPMVGMGMTFGPANEMGVMCLFCMLAWYLGYVVMRVQPGFPDCEAMRRITDQKWQKMRIEFEYESRNFVRHGHPPEGCDVIVCWIHNWPECPLEVVELSKVKFCAGCEGR